MSERKPMVLVFAGPNGSGKTTIKELFQIVGEYTNADDVVSSTKMDNFKAAKFVDELRYKAISEKRDFTFETVLSSSYKLQILHQAKENGFFIKCVFILTADPNINVTRVRQRVVQGGHSVEPDKIRTRYYKSLANIPELLSICDILHVYDNTERATRIVRKHKDQLSIFPNEYWTEEQLFNLIGIHS